MPDTNFTKVARPSIGQQQIDEVNEAYTNRLNRDIAVLAELLLEKLEARQDHVEAVGSTVPFEGHDREILRDLRGTLSALIPY